MMRLHGYWRSGAAYRVRIALNLKGLAYEQVSHDLRTGAQGNAEYAALNPQKLVPAIEADGLVLTQSGAILEWLEEAYPTPPLLPRDVAARAVVRAMVGLVACDVHPLNNLRVLNALRSELGADKAQVSAWITRWIGDGFSALETMIERHGGAYAFGDAPTLADCFIVPQVYSAERFGVSLAAFPRVLTAATAARSLPQVAAADPAMQPDAD